jgi:KUP system potassium uptake protein
LAVTGVEALYADMGHFNRTAISKAWYFVVMPCLVLNYFGQGAYVFSHPESTNPFFEMIPEGFLRYGMSFFSIVAAVIASQAVITGAFSVTLAAIQMGYFPRLKVLHTSSQISGQIYVPFINFILAAVSLAIVIVFQTSSSLAVAYGVAVTGAMIVTTWLYYFYLINQREWEQHKAILLCGFLWVIDWAMFLSAMHKFVGVGWVAFLVSLVFFVIMHTWRSGRKAVSSAIEGSGRHLEELKVTSVVRSKQLQRVSGCAVFMSASTKGIPVVLMHYIKVSKCLHNTTVILTLATEKTPVVDDRDRLQVRDLGEGIWKVRCSYGYMEQPDVNHLCSMMVASGIPLVLDETTFFFNREIVVSGGQSKLFEWQKYLYSFLARNAQPMRDYYRVMQHQLIEVGLPVRI